jgi:hypothetical protein
MCLIQEPYIDFKGKTRANQNWAVLYPNTHEKYPDHTRSVILINTNMLSDAWKQIHFDHPDITVIEIQGHFGTLWLINVYNDCDNNSSLTRLAAYM